MNPVAVSIWVAIARPVRFNDKDILSAETDSAERPVSAMEPCASTAYLVAPELSAKTKTAPRASLRVAEASPISISETDRSSNPISSCRLLAPATETVRDVTRASPLKTGPPATDRDKLSTITVWIWRSLSNANFRDTPPTLMVSSTTRPSVFTATKPEAAEKDRSPPNPFRATEPSAIIATPISPNAARSKTIAKSTFLTISPVSSAPTATDASFAPTTKRSPNVVSCLETLKLPCTVANPSKAMVPFAVIARSGLPAVKVIEPSA